jgi:hypothetical protein
MEVRKLPLEPNWSVTCQKCGMALKQNAAASLIIEKNKQTTYLTPTNFVASTVYDALRLNENAMDSVSYTANTNVSENIR